MAGAVRYFVTTGGVKCGSCRKKYATLWKLVARFRRGNMGRQNVAASGAAILVI